MNNKQTHLAPKYNPLIQGLRVEKSSYSKVDDDAVLESTNFLRKKLPLNTSEIVGSVLKKQYKNMY